MQDPTILQPKYWRQRAGEAREAAKDVVHPANRKILEDVARSYEEMADLMEKHERSAGPAPPNGNHAGDRPPGPDGRPRTGFSIQR